MKRKITILAVLLSLVVVLGSCASKRYTKKGLKYEALGQYSDAADMFYQALSIKRTNIEAMAGLKRTGQMTLSKKLSEFNKAYNDQKNKEAVYYYQDAKDYYNKIASVGVELNFPSFYDEYYDEVKNVYVEDKYYEGIKFLDDEKFADAEKAFREVVKFQSNYKDAEDKLVISINEPKYRNGLKLMDQQQFRKAYYVFDEIIRNASNYKNSHELKAECLEKGTIVVQISKIQNVSTDAQIASTLEAKIIENILEANNPFIKLVDAGNKTATGKGFYNQTISTNTQNRPPDVILNVEISKFVYNKGDLKETEKRGYLKKQVKVTNRETGEEEVKIKYDKVTYKEFFMNRSVDLNFSYKLINGKTNVILKTASRNYIAKDEVNYARYQGDTKNLVPGYWKWLFISSSEDYISDNPKSIKALQNLLNARSQIKDYKTLAEEVVNKTAAEISEAVIDYVVKN